MNNERILLVAKRLDEALLSGQWITNTNIKDVISDLDWKQATIQINSYNSIAILTFHITYYLKGVLQVLNGGTLDIRDKFSFDMPSVDSSEKWEALKNDFIIHAESFVQKVKEMRDDELDAPFVESQYGNYQRNLDAMIEHAYYHLGQMVLIKKTILSKNN